MHLQLAEEKIRDVRAVASFDTNPPCTYVHLRRQPLQECGKVLCQRVVHLHLQRGLAWLGLGLAVRVRARVRLTLTLTRLAGELVAVEVEVEALRV